MTYEEIINKINSGVKVFANEVSGTQLFMLIHDRIINGVQFRNTLYEFNFIPIEEPTRNCIFINDELYPVGKSLEELFHTIICSYEEKQIIGIALNDEYYTLELEVLETK